MIVNENKLKAEKGFYLTNGETFGKIVYLSENDSADNWLEITEEEAEKMQGAGDSNAG
mgnify:CR=1 FL=1